MDPLDKFLGEFKEFMEKTPQEEIDRRWKEALSNKEGGLTVGDLMKQPIILGKHKVVVTNLIRKELVGKTRWNGLTSKGSKIVIVYHSDGHLSVEIDGNFVSGIGLNPKEQPKGKMSTVKMLEELPNRECRQFEWVE